MLVCLPNLYVDVMLVAYDYKLTKKCCMFQRAEKWKSPFL